MNILRKNRKRNSKVNLRRYILLIFSLIMTTFAWFTYSKILDTGFEFHIESWDISFYLDEDKDGEAELTEKIDSTDPIDIELSNLYPGMEDQTVNVIIKNNGELASDISYTIPEIVLLGNEYAIVESVNASTPDYYILRNASTVTEGIVYTGLINEPTRFPFKIEIENTQQISSEGEGYLNVKISWPLYNADDTEEEKNDKDELDTEWGYDVGAYIKGGGTEVFDMQLRINAIQPRSTT